MTLPSFGCKKFRLLSSEREDRDLNVSELRFMDKHRDICEECRDTERTSVCALNMLRLATLEAEAPPMFEDRIIRRLKVQQVKESLNYWSPALFGATIACIVIFVTLHLASAPAQMKRANLPGGAAMNDGHSRYLPSLELSRTPNIR